MGKRGSSGIKYETISDQLSDGGEIIEEIDGRRRQGQTQRKKLRSEKGEQQGSFS